MAEIDLKKTTDIRILMFSVNFGIPDMPRRDHTRKPIVPLEVRLEYRRTDGGPWSVDDLKVYGRSRLRGGGVGDAWVTEVLHQRAGIGDVPPERWPDWLRELTETYRPRT